MPQARNINSQMADLFQGLSSRHERHFYRNQTPQKINTIFVKLDALGYDAWLEVGTFTFDVFSYDQIVPTLLDQAKAHGFNNKAAFRAIGASTADGMNIRNRGLAKPIAYYLRLAELSNKTVYLYYRNRRNETVYNVKIIADK
jgi:hypothetical protein